MNFASPFRNSTVSLPFQVMASRSGAMLVNHAVKVRIYPTVAQEELLAKALGCKRWIWNQLTPDFSWPEFVWMLDYKCRWAGKYLVKVDGSTRRPSTVRNGGGRAPHVELITTATGTPQVT
ncbi:helix-turn-helix domain-containing protein [Candidatus Bathyarchaeota archaeon]|nr:helix-turn-helix domain-containing protein [Candidatus Bathyarchaeota archaeon]